MVSKRTESWAVGELKNIIHRSKIIFAFVEENDKTPIWDGNLFVYNKPAKGRLDNKKKDLNGKIPVQVKGKSVDKLSINTTSHYFESADLKAYYQDGGVMLFVVEIADNPDYKRIFYASLLPCDIKTLVGDFNKAKNKIKVTLEHLEASKIKEFEDECENFILHREMQYSTKEIQLPMEEAKEIFIKGKLRNYSFEDYILNNSMYLYGKCSEDDYTRPLLVDKIDFHAIEKQMNRNVSINGKTYFEIYKVRRKKKHTELIFDDNLVFIFKEGNMKFNYDYHKNFAKLFNSVEFLKCFIENGSFTIAGQDINLTSDELSNDKYEYIKNHYKRLKDISTLLDMFGVNYCNLDMNEIKEEEARKLDILIDTMIYGNSAPNIENSPGIFKFKIGNIKLLTFAYRNQDGKIIIKDFSSFNKKLVLKPSNEKDKLLKNISPYIILNFEDILSTNNIDPFTISDSIKKSNYTDIYSDYVVNLMLDMIKVFDRIEDYDYLDGALEICKWLRDNNSENPVNIINEYQIYKRKRELKKKEIEILKDMIEARKDDFELLSCIYILLEDFDQFKETFNNLSDKQKERFKEYPIYTLYTD